MEDVNITSWNTSDRSEFNNKYRALTKQQPVSSGLRPVTSVEYKTYLEKLDEFEESGNLKILQSAVKPDWPFSQKVSKASAYIDLEIRPKDEDIVAVYHALTQSNDVLKPEHLNVLILYNLLIRRGIDPDVNAKKLHYFMSANLDEYVQNFNVRWFVSYCDSVSDSAIFPDHYRQNATLVSTIIAALKVAISPYVILDNSNIDLFDLIDRNDAKRLPLGGGMITFWQTGGDVISNMLERAMRTTGNNDLIGLLFHHSVHTLLFQEDSNPCLKKLIELSNNPVNKHKLEKIQSMISSSNKKLFSD